MNKLSHVLTAIFLMLAALFAVIRPSFMSSSKALDKDDLLIKEYVTLRNTIVKDPDKMAARWGGKHGVCYYSSDSVCAEFADNALKEQDIVMNKRIERDVEFITFDKKQPGVWETEFITKDVAENYEEIISRKWKAVIYASSISDDIKTLKNLSQKASFIVNYYAQEEKPLRKLPSKMANIKELVSRYISLRFSTFGSIEDTAIYWGERGPLRQISSLENYQNISEGLAQDLARFNIQNLERSILIDDAEKISSDKWRVYFKSFDYFPDKEEPLIRNWQAVLTIDFRKSDALFDGVNEPLSGVSYFFEGFNNPSGFMVTKQELYAQNSDNEILYIDAPSKGVMEDTPQMIIDYLKMRHSITDNAEQMRNDWGLNGKIKELSSEKTFIDFYVKAVFLFDVFSKSKMTRDFEILAVEDLGNKIDTVGGKEWRATFLTRDFDNNNLTEERVWQASFRTVIVPNSANDKFAQIMPHRFLVHDYKSSSEQLYPNPEQSLEQLFIAKYLFQQLQQPLYKEMLLLQHDFKDYETTIISIKNIVDNLFEVSFVIKDKTISYYKEQPGKIWHAEINLIKKDGSTSFDAGYFNLEQN
ncbi:MAG: hypothetical protein AB7U85_01195 [Alphaproteobacteria bacterium]